MYVIMNSNGYYYADNDKWVKQQRKAVTFGDKLSAETYAKHLNGMAVKL